MKSGSTITKKIETCTYFSYLGVNLSSVLSWTYNQKTRAEKGLKALGSCKTLMYRIPVISSEIMWNVFDTKIKPVVHYGAEIWGYNDSPEIERVQTNMCKSILKINSKVPSISLRGELGRYPLKINRLLTIIRYWLRLNEMSNVRLTKDAYKLQQNWVEQRKQCWLLEVQKILSTHGFNEVWINQGVGEKVIF